MSDRQVIPEAAVEAAIIAAHGAPRKGNKTLHKAMRHILEAAAPYIRAAALEEAADEADGVIAAGDIAEVAAPVEGESGRGEAVAARDSLYEEGPGGWLRVRAATCAPAPHMGYAGWAGAYAAGFMDAKDGENYNATNTNPLRPTL